MSTINEINKVWVQKFPGSQLPAAWEEDVKTNLGKHKKRVGELEEELEQERVYVQFLESLLAEVENKKERKNLIETDSKIIQTEEEEVDVDWRNNHSEVEIGEHIDHIIQDTLKRRSLANKETATEFSLLDSVDEKIEEPTEPQSEEIVLSSLLSSELEKSVEEEGSGTEDHFVTVIEVNGFEKLASQGAKLKKIPPRPPPKFKQRTAEMSSIRPVIFDSRKKDENETVVPPVDSSVPNGEIPSKNGKKFQGSKLPLPGEQRKILEMVSKMESKVIGQAESPKRSFRKKVAEALVPDYVDPLDADFEEKIGDTIYDSPPPEEDTFEVISSSQSGVCLENQLNSLETQDPYAEPMYDTVAADQDDDYVVLSEERSSGRNGGPSSHTNSLSGGDKSTIKSQTSIMSEQSITTTASSASEDTEGLPASPLPLDSSHGLSHKNSANYVNIDYFLCKTGRKDSQASCESEEDEPSSLLRTVSVEGERSLGGDGSPDSTVELFDLDSGVYGSSTDSVRGVECSTMTAAEQEKFARFRYLLPKIAESEGAYVDVLNVMIHYMKALKATLGTSKPVLSQDEFNIMFYKIPELYELHRKFLLGLQQKSPGSSSVGKHFLNLAHDIGVYGAFLQNYSRAVETVRKCSQNNSDFAEIAKNIRLKSLNNQAVSLETLLYSPVSRIQKNIEIIQDLLKCLPVSHPDHVSLKSALREFQSFLTEFKMIQPEQLFQGQDRNPRHLVKNSFIVELSEGHRKLRHLFLFNDVLVCAKYKASGKGEKFTFELKWYIPVSECSVLEENSELRETAPINLVALRSQASTVRDQIKRQTSRDDPKKAKAEKQRKKLAELEAQLVLASPNLVFKVRHGNGRSYTFFLSSEYERSQWIDTIDALKASQLCSSSSLSMHELQSWLTSCRKHLKTNMGSYLLRSGRDETLLVGDLYILIDQLKGIQRAADLYICLEVDSYGHFFRKAKTKMICESTSPCWNQDFTIELEGAQNLRILLYEDHQRQGTLIRAKTTIELNRSWLSTTMTERKIDLQDYVLTIFTKFTPSEMTIRRVPTAKPSGLFGAKITQVCKREKRQVPFILTSCLREVERRGINEVGIYRVSGSTSDVNRLKKAFETNSYEAEQLLKEVDIHSVTGILKLYLRELPEALFTDQLYPKFFEAFNSHDQETKKRALLQHFGELPPLNHHTIQLLLDHMIRINKHEGHNKMSLHNIATVFGPTLLRPAAKSEGSGCTDLLAARTVDVMAQAGILYFFLTRRANGDATL